MKKRLDLLMVERALAPSREKAKAYIMSGDVYVDGQKEDKAGTMFQETVKIYQQGKAYYDALKSVHDLVKGARKVQQTILLVGDISDIYVTNFNTMMGDPNFTVEELSAIAFGYNRLLEESSNLLLDLKEVTTATGLSMTDKERLDIINRIYGEVLEYKNLTWYYTRKNIGISYLRSKKKGDSQRVLALYGTHDQRYW